MRRLPLLLLLVIVPAAEGQIASAGQSPGNASVSARMIEIDGRKNPELIPEWLAWRQAFRTLALVDFEKSAFTQNLVLTAEEKEVVLKEARLEKSREAACAERQEKIQEQWAKATPEVLQLHVNEELIACRWLTLDARDRVLDAIGPEARVSLEVFLGETRAATQSLVPKDGLELFRRPQ